MKCLRGNAGVTMVELMVAMGVMTIALFMALQQSRTIFRQADKMQKVVDVESEQVTVNKVLSAAYVRGLEAVYKHIPGPAGADATPGAYYLARGNGAGLMSADMTQCPDFVPGSTTSAKSYYGFVCCQADSAASITLPSGYSRTLKVSDGCQGRAGLNVLEIDSSGKVSNTCSPEYKDIRIMKVGYDTNLGSDVIQLTLRTNVGFSENSDAAGRRYEAIFVLGATGAEQITECRRTVSKQTP